MKDKNLFRTKTPIGAQPDPKNPVQLETGESLMADLLNREYKPDTTALPSAPQVSASDSADFAALLNGDFKPAVVPVVPAPIEMEEIDVMVWIEKEIVIDQCAICGKIRCSCPNRILITRKLRYQQKQKQMRPKQ